jgi:hypothetical protein
VDAIERIYCYERQILLRDSWWIRFFTRIKRGFVTMFNIRRYNEALGIRKRLCMFIFTDIFGDNVNQRGSYIHDSTSPPCASILPKDSSTCPRYFTNPTASSAHLGGKVETNLMDSGEKVKGKGY